MQPDPTADLSGVAVIFDLDGTLVDTAGDLAAAMNFALAAAGRPAVPAARVRHLVGHGAMAMLARGFEETGALPPSMDAHLEVFLDYYVAHIADESRPFPHAIEAVEALRAAGARIAICTNKQEGSARLLIEALGLASMFDAIIGRETAGAAKPDPAPVRLAMTRTGATRAVFVGDSDTDIRAARAAGLPCLVATFGYGPVTLSDLFTKSFDDYAALPSLVREALKWRR